MSAKQLRRIAKNEANKLLFPKKIKIINDVQEQMAPDQTSFEHIVQKNEEKLKQFKQFIVKTGGEGHTQFIRAAIRKVFSDELASAFSWKGTSTKPNAEKCFLVTTIKNIFHAKFKSNDKDMNVVLQKHFVHAGDRLAKRKRVE